ncbi:MAG: hypothetical protein BWY78_00790 [Alphaproteobacteria bacterium ADurb.Bin438]|nr:MAG: hypothetical protein BWY78_00790 [Alphaproteobacteria bacterium ADurb.Bin438]
MTVNLYNEKDLNKYIANIFYGTDEIEKLSKEDFQNVSSSHVRENHDKLVRALVYQWAKHRLRSHFTGSEEFFLPLTITKGMEPWAEKALREGQKIFTFEERKVPASLTQEMNEVKDFLYSRGSDYLDKEVKKATQGGLDKPLNLRIDYLKVTNEFSDFNKALYASKKWHELLAAKAKKVKKDRDFLDKSEQGVNFEMELSDGMKIVRLNTSEALDFESNIMGHCVGKGSYDSGVKAGTLEIYSLRDKNGEPHATFEVRGNKLYQCKGKENKAPVVKYLKYTSEFILNKGLDISSCEDKNKIGLFDQDGKIHNVFNLPEGFVVKGNLDMSEMNLDVLPDLTKVKIMGDLNISFNNLKSLKGCPDEIGGSLHCFYNKLESLEGAPSKIKKVFDCSYNKLKNLEGSIKEVGSDYLCIGNELETLKGAPLKVNGHFKCSKNKLESLEFAPEVVTRNFDCSENNLKSLEGGPKKGF